MKIKMRTKRWLASLMCGVMLLTGMPVIALEQTAPTPVSQSTASLQDVSESESQSVPVTESQNTPVSESQGDSVTESQGDSVTESQSAPLTESQSAPATEPQSAPATDSQGTATAEAAPAPLASLGQVRVIVENTTFPKASGAPWDGVLVDSWVSINAESTMMTALIDALTAAGKTQQGAESNYISEIDGLAAFDGGGASGWMGTLNDWFTNEGFGAFTVASGKLAANDEIRIMYTCNGYGEDLGSSWGNNDKTVKTIDFSAGTLSPTFDKAVKEYTLTIPQGTTGVTVAPTASNKNFQVRTSANGIEYKRTQEVPVENGTILTVKCGDPAWPTMNGATDVPAETYTITVAEHSTDVKNYLSDLAFGTKSKKSDDGAFFAMTPAFDAAQHTYTVCIPDAVVNPRIWATLADGAPEGSTIYANYTHKILNRPNSVKITSGNDFSAVLSGLVKGDLIGTSLTLAVGTPENLDEYTVNITRQVTLKTLSVKADGVELLPKFSRANFDVMLSASSSVKALSFTATADANAHITVNGQTVVGGAAIDVPLSFKNGPVQIPVTVSIDGAASSSYTITVNNADQPSLPEITQQPVGHEYLVENSSSALPFKIKAKTQDNRTLKYQWYSNSTESNEGGTLLEKATADTFYPPVYKEPNTTWYYCIVTNESADGLPEHFSKAVSQPVKVSYRSQAEFIAAAGLTGSGTEELPYLLKTAKDMKALSDLVRLQGCQFANTYFKLNADITLPADWVSIGSKAEDGSIKPFCGIFDGGSHTLTFAHGSVPLFGYVKDTVIQNVSIFAPYINGYGLVNHYSVGYGSMNIANVTIKEGSCIKYSGFLGGYASGRNEVTVKDCTVEKNVKIGFDADANASSGSVSVGSFGGDFNGTITNCKSSAAVYGADFVGGLVGGKGQTMGPYTIIDSLFDGTVTASGKFVGGIAGSGYTGVQWGIASAPNTPCATIQNCTVNAVITGATCVGGIFGGEEGVVQCWDNGIGAIQNNTFSGKVTATQPDGIVGGIIGYMNSLDRYNIIEGNTYNADCGAAKGIGAVKYIDTNCKTVDNSDKNVVYFCTQTGAESGTAPQGAKKADHNRTDDPLGADADELTSLSKEKAYQAVIKLIDAIGTVTRDSGSAITKARSAYDLLKAEEMKLVSNYDTLVAAEKTYADLMNPNEKLNVCYAATGAHILTHTPNPVVSSVGGEWAVFGLARAGYPVGKGFNETYIANLVQTLQDKNGVLDTRKYTEYSRVVLALTSIGYDVTEVAGYNMLAPLADFDQTVWQGINGGIFALLAFDSHGYDIPAAPEGKVQTTREKLITFILSKEIAGGGWALLGTTPDPDITAMALQSLAPYYNKNTDVKAAVDRALAKMSSAQTVTGGFSSWGNANSESCAQMLTALTSLGIDPLTDARFIKNGNTVLDAMLSYYVDGGGFKHVPTGALNYMATEQCYYALASYSRFKSGKTALYDMSDVKIDAPYQTVIQMIDAIGTVTLKNADHVSAIRAAYNALSAAHKAQVTNYSLLQAAETTAEALLKNLRAAEKLIDAIGDVTLESKEKISAAKAAYDALTAAEKALVTNYDLLSRALVRIAQLEKADAVRKLIDAIGTVTKDSAEKIKAARAAYDALNTWEQALVPNVETLIAAERALLKLTPSGDRKVIGIGQTGIIVGGKKYIVDKQSAELIKKLDKLPQSKKLEEKSVVELFKIYQELTDKQKAEIINFEVLESQMKQIAAENQTDVQSGIMLENADWNIKLNVQPVKLSSGEAERLRNSLGSNTMLLLFDINLTDILTQKSYQPADSLKIKMPMPAEMNGEEHVMIAHFKDDGTVEYIDCESIAGHLVWEASSFSYYAVVSAATEAQQTLPQETDQSTAVLTGQNRTTAVWLIWVWVALAAAGIALLVFAAYQKKRASDK